MSRSRTFLFSITDGNESDWNNIYNLINDDRIEYITAYKSNNTIQGFIRYKFIKSIKTVNNMFYKKAQITVENNKDKYYKEYFSKHQQFFEAGNPAKRNQNIDKVIKESTRKKEQNEILMAENEKKIKELEIIVQKIKRNQVEKLEYILKLLQNNNEIDK